MHWFIVSVNVKFDDWLKLNRTQVNGSIKLVIRLMNKLRHSWHFHKIPSIHLKYSEVTTYVIIPMLKLAYFKINCQKNFNNFWICTSR